MGAVEVYSPHDGQPVRVREQDIGRAVRDGEGRIFYVLEKSDGSGYYGATTRAGGEREERRARELEQKLAKADAKKQQEVHAARHDATGKRDASWIGRLIVVVIVLVLAALACAYLFPAVWEMAVEYARRLSTVFEPRAHGALAGTGATARSGPVT